MATHRFLIAGAGGRMGRAVIRAAVETPGVALAGGVDRAESAAVGQDLGPLAGLDALGLKVTHTDAAKLDAATAVIDFSAPGASVALAARAAETGTSMVIGTTGFAAEEEAAIVRAAEKTAIVKSGNMSLGVNLLAALVKEAAARLDPAHYDIDIIEAHHRDKVDAPSGTALMLGRAAADGRGVALDDVAAHDRSGKRADGAIGFAVVRGGGIVGEHSALFAGRQEVIELTHKAIDRDLFARGAVTAAQWAAGRPPGLYDMTDVLGLYSGRQ
ncbi:MAG: 4-hydroxy-tetrahydrodipicolinate reductase [Pseudomonadota bacterium]